MVTWSRTSTILSSISRMKLRSSHSVTVGLELRYATSYPYVRKFSHPVYLEHDLNVNSSEILANVDAILFLPATRYLYQDSCGEIVYLAIELG